MRYGGCPVFHKTDAMEQKNSCSQNITEFPRSETHGIAQWPKHRLMADSHGLRWRDVYVSLASEFSWDRQLGSVPHLCVAYCMHRPASVTRSVSGDAKLTNVNLRPRTFGVVPESRPSEWQLRGTPDILTVYLRRSMVDSIASEWFGTELSRVELIPRLAFSDPMLEQLGLQLLSAMRSDDPLGDGLYADQLARMFTLHLLREHSARPPKARGLPAPTPTMSSARMQHVREIVEAELDGDLGLIRLAAEAGVGEHAFSVAFTKAFGNTPHSYVIGRRIERAKHLLRSSDLPVVDVAAQTGFASQSHLASVFKRTVGLTPGGYRQGKQQGSDAGEF